MLALSKVKGGKGETAMAQYEKFVSSLKVPESEKDLMRLKIAQNLQSPEESLKYLSKISQVPDLRNEWRLFDIRHKLIYGGISDIDFTDGYGGPIRDYYIYYLMSQGRFKNILTLMTPPEDFPEFWKVFVCWKQNIASWKEQCELLIEKHKNNPDPLIPVAASIMLGKITPDEARSLLKRLPPEDEPFLLLVLAESYMKSNNKLKAKVCFALAARDKTNPLLPVINFFKQRAE